MTTAERHKKSLRFIVPVAVIAYVIILVTGSLTFFALSGNIFIITLIVMIAMICIYLWVGIFLSRRGLRREGIYLYPRVTQPERTEKQLEEWMDNYMREEFGLTKGEEHDEK